MPFSRLAGLFSRHPLHPLLAANHARFAGFNQKLGLEEYDFVVFDTELTGLDPKSDELIAIGAVRIKNLRIQASQTFHSHIKPQVIEPRDATLIHRITPEQLKEAPELDRVLTAFIEFCGGSLLVGHYIDLDMTFLNRVIRQRFYATLKNPGLDTMRLAHLYKTLCWENYYDRYDLQVSYNLADLSEAYGLPAFTRHDAFEDAMQTAYLFLFLVKQLKRQGLRTLQDLFTAGRSWRSLF